MEKPVATDAAGVRQVLAAAEEAKKKNLKVGVGLQRHHQAGYIETMKRLHDGEIGDIVSMRCYWNGQRPWQKKRADLEKQYGRKLTEMEYQLRNWYYFTWIGGDHIVEQHIHNLDVINWVKKGHPVKARAMGGREISNGGADDGEIFDHFAVRVRIRGRLDLLTATAATSPAAGTASASMSSGTKGTVRCQRQQDLRREPVALQSRGREGSVSAGARRSLRRDPQEQGIQRSRHTARKAR